MSELYVVNADGTGLVRIPAGGFETQPAWSPSGTRIAFVAPGPEQSTWNGPSHYELWVVNPDGTGRVRLTSNQAIESLPQWLR